MITYVYWILAMSIAGAIFLLIGIRAGKYQAGAAVGAFVIAIAWAGYYFYLEQMFVKRWGGVMSITVPKGQHHILVTWKDDNFWVENYDPNSNTCIFQEYSRSGLLEGKVVINECNPYMKP
jgi:hypothetical protein